MLKNILITGANSYIGTSLEKWLNQYPDKYKINTVDMINNNWREKSFEGYDVVKEKLPLNAKGNMTIEEIEVDYY